ncbi:ribonuclease P protein subunit p25-like protein isoform X2 [Sitodiplosis mosellana]|nr:ribonuclease P protein subunit p25-like protein isoform X2 [Sitodiplosis mosellana]XP_055317954.1 ribonuclease P protein subunit p25-like protein isoform X2 [Sitodiplosis mosellana]
MMNYRKGRNVEEELTRNDIQIENLPEDFLWMHVKGGTAVPNVIEFAKKALQSGEHRTIVWTGYGGGVGKTISCAEILKRDFTLHQVTRLCYKTNEEYWDPLLDGLEPIVVKRNIPCVHILMSLDEIDPKSPGYQFSKNKTTFWVESNHNRSNNSNRRESQGNQPLRANRSDANEPSNNQNQQKPKKPNRKPKGNSNQMEVD